MSDQEFKTIYFTDQNGNTVATIKGDRQAGTELEVPHSKNIVTQDKPGQATFAPKAMLVSRSGDDLNIIVSKEEYISVKDYYTKCEDDKCLVSVADGEGGLVDITLDVEGFALKDGDQIVYMQGDRELLLSMVNDQAGFNELYDFISTSDATSIESTLISNNPKVFGDFGIASAAGIAGGLLGVGALASGGSIASVITASVLLGPLTDTAGTIVSLYQADGITKLGDMTYNVTTGLFELKYDGTYTGPVIAVLTDHDTATDYKDEATKEEIDIGDSALLVLSTLSEGQDGLSLSINEATTAAAFKAGVSAVKNGKEQTVTVPDSLTSEKVNEANTAIAKALGLEGVDLSTTEAKAVINTDGAVNTDANDYGVVLAQLSQARQDTDQTITELAQDLGNGVNDKGESNSSIAATLVKAANAVANDPAYASVAVVQTDTTDGLTAIGKAVANNDDADDIITANLLASITGVEGVVPGNLAEYQKAIKAATTLSDPATVEAVQAIITEVNDAIPTVTITSDVNTLKTGATATITFTLSKASNDFVADDVTVAGGELSALTQDADNSLVYTATFTPTADRTTDGSVSVAADVFTDTDGTPTNNAASTPYTLNVDTSAPTISTVTPSWGNTVNAIDAGSDGTVTVATTGVEDDQMAIFSLNGKDYKGEVENNSATITVPAGVLQGLTDGQQYSYTVNVSDAVGNAAPASAGSFTVDTTAPTVSIAYQDENGQPIDALKAGETATVVFTLSEASSDFAKEDIMVSGGNISTFTQDGASLRYKATFIPTANSTTVGSVSVAADKFTDTAGNNNTAADAVTISLNTTVPTVSSVVISGSQSNGTTPKTSALVVGDKVIVTVTMSEATVVETTNGTPQYTIDVGGTSRVASYVSGSDTSRLVFAYTVEENDNDTMGGITAAAGALDANGGALTNVTGNAATLITQGIQTDSNDVAVDTTAPTVSITYKDENGQPINALKAGETATVVFTLSEDSEDFDDATVTVAGGDLSDFAQDGTNPLLYTATFTPTEDSTDDGSISVAAGEFTDAAGNNNTAATAETINVDTQVPTIGEVDLSWGTTLNATEDNSAGTVTINTTGVENNQDVTLTLGGTDYTGTVTGNSTSITVAATDLAELTQGTQNYTVNVSDDAGNAAIKDTGSFTVDTTAPTVTIAYKDGTTTIDALKAGETATVVFTLSEDSEDFDDATVTASGGTLDDITGSGTSYQATFTPTPNSTTQGSISIAAGEFTDAAGNYNTAATAVRIDVDTVIPTVTIAYQDAGGGNITALKAGEKATVVFTLSEAPDSFTNADVTVAGGILDDIEGSGKDYTATFTPTANSTADGSISVAADKFTDAAGNGNAAAPAVTIGVDTQPPTTTVTIDSITDDTGSSNTDFITNDTDLTIKATLSAALVADDESLEYSIDGGDNWKTVDSTNITGDPATTVSFIDNNLTATATLKMRVVDAAGNAGTEISQLITIDTTLPKATVITVMENQNAESITLTNGANTDDTTPVVRVNFNNVDSGETNEPANIAAGDVIQLYNGSDAIGTAYTVTTSDVDQGHADVNLTELEADSTDYAITAEVTDVSGNKGVASNSFAFTVGTVEQPVSNTENIDLNSDDDVTLIYPVISDLTGTGTVSLVSGFDKARDKLNLAGLLTGEERSTIGEYLNITVDGGRTTIYINTDGTDTNDFTIALGNTELANAGTLTLDAIQGLIDDGLIIIGAVPKATVITVLENQNAELITLTDGANTDDTTPVVRVTFDNTPSVGANEPANIAAGDAIQLYNGSDAIGTAYTVTASDVNQGYADVNLTELEANSTDYAITARVADAIGNKGVASDPFAFTVGTVDQPVSNTENIDLNSDDDVTLIYPVISDLTGTGTVSIVSGFDKARDKLNLAGLLTGEDKGTIGGYLDIAIAEGRTTISINTDGTGTDEGFNDFTIVLGNTELSDESTLTPEAIQGLIDDGLIIIGAVPKATVITVMENQNTESLTDGANTDDTTPVVRVTFNNATSVGANEPANIATGDVIQLYNGSDAIGTAYTVKTSDVNQGYADVNLTDLEANSTDYAITARVADAIGNKGVASNSFAFTVGTVEQTISNQALITLSPDDDETLIYPQISDLLVDGDTTTVYNFDQARDKLNLADLLIGEDKDTIDNYLNIVITDNNRTSIKVDIDGTGNEDGFATKDFHIIFYGTLLGTAGTTLDLTAIQGLIDDGLIIIG